MHPRIDLRAELALGRTAIAPGRVPQIVPILRARPRLAARVLALLWDDDQGVAGRAADLLERVSRTPSSFPAAPAGKPPAAAILRILNDSRTALTGLVPEAHSKKLRWNLAYLIPRLALTRTELHRAYSLLRAYLTDESSIVKTAALHSLFDLAHKERDLLPEVIELLQITARSGTAAMRARSRILLKRHARAANASADTLAI